MALHTSDSTSTLYFMYDDLHYRKWTNQCSVGSRRLCSDHGDSDNKCTNALEVEQYISHSDSDSEAALQCSMTLYFVMYSMSQIRQPNVSVVRA